MELPNNKKEKFTTKYRNILIGIFAVSIYLLAAKTSELSSGFILNHYDNHVVPDDFFFELLPYHVAFEYITEIIFMIMFAVFIYSVLKYAKKAFFYYWSVAWIYMLWRSFVMLLTPLGRPLSPDMLHGLLRLADPTQLGNEVYYRMGMFPSGHLGLCTVGYLSVRAVAPKWVDRLMLLLLFFEAVFMIASRGHYTIDIIGAVSFVILIYIFSEKYLKKLLTMK
jgi:hypothetical protein